MAFACELPILSEFAAAASVLVVVVAGDRANRVLVARGSSGS